MADNIRLKIRGLDVEFRKSPDLVGIKPALPVPKSTESAVRSIGLQPLTGEVLGGFQLARAGKTVEETDRNLDVARANPVVSVGTHVFHTSDDGVPFVPTGVLFVRFTGAATPEERRSLLKSHSLEILEARTSDEFLVKVSPQSDNPLKVSARLQDSPLVSIAEPEFASPARLLQIDLTQDALLQEQWHLRNTGHHRGSSVGFVKGADARVIDAWQELNSFGSPEVVIAVIDDGFDLTHPDLAAEGKIVHPWDFGRNTTDPSPGDGDWHGTACAGVAAAASGAGQVVGAAPSARVMPIRWSGFLSDSDIERWFEHAQTSGASVVSCSWSARARHFPLTERMFQAIDRCATEGRGGRGCVIVFAAGNSNVDIDDAAGRTVNGFATHPSVIAVSASTSNDEAASYSSHGKSISVCAPSNGQGGWGILTADVTGVTASGAHRGYGKGDYTYDFGGTSSACPLVSGVCALVLNANPQLTAAEVKALLQRTARKIGPLTEYENGHSTAFGHGCVNAHEVVKEALALAAPATPNTAPSFSTSIRPLFRQKDIVAMKNFGGFDLSKHADVAANADAILARLAEGSMPCDGAWPQESVDLFKAWIDGGKQP